MKYEIDIDLGPLADAWEPVAFREPLKGESYLSSGATSGSSVREAGQNFCDMGGPTESYLIVRRRWKWPEWLTAEWYCEWQNGSQYVSVYEPLLVSGRSDWLGNGTMKCLDGVVDIPKIGGDWRQSKRRNPRSK